MNILIKINDRSWTSVNYKKLLYHLIENIVSLTGYPSRSDKIPDKSIFLSVVYSQIFRTASFLFTLSLFEIKTNIRINGSLYFLIVE